MMNRRTWIAGITVTSLLAALLTACKQEQREQEMRQTLPVMVVSSRAVEFQESYSASIRGRQDVDIVPQVSGRITRLCVKEGEQVKTGQVLAVIPSALSGSLAHRTGKRQRSTGKSGNGTDRAARQASLV